MEHTNKKLQRIPSSFEKDREPQPMRAEAIAMRRIVAEMGYWLSPMLKNHPIPVLTEWEKTVDLSTLGHSERAKNSEENRRERHNVLSRYDAPESKKEKSRRGVDPTRKRKIQTLQELEDERRAKENKRKDRKKNKLGKSGL